MLRRSFLRASASATIYPFLPGSPANAFSAKTSSEIIDLREYLDRSGTPGSENRNAVGLAAALSYARKLNGGFVLRGHAGDVYRIPDASSWRLSGAGKLCLEGGAFHIAPSNSTVRHPQFTFDQGWSVEGASFIGLAGSNVMRLADFEGHNAVSDCTFTSVEQTENSGRLLAYAVRILRGGNTISRINLKNFDKALIAYGADGDGAPAQGNRFVDISVENYLTGFELRNQLDCRNKGYRSSGRSYNATQDPGQNGLLHSGVADYVLSDFQIADAGEHGCRFGGTRYKEQTSQSIVVNRGVIRRSGQSGVKFFSGHQGQRFKNVRVENVNVIDCQYLPNSPSNLPGFNDEGFLLQQIDTGYFNGLTVTTEAKKNLYSCDCAFYISGARQVHLSGIWATHTYRDLFRLSQWDDGVGKASVETLPSEAISIQDAVGKEISGSALFLDFPTSTIKDSSIDLEASGIRHPEQKGIAGNLGPSSLRGVSIRYRLNEFDGELVTPLLRQSRGLHLSK